MFQEYYVKVYETDLYFYKHYKQKIKADENECNYMLC